MISRSSLLVLFFVVLCALNGTGGSSRTADASTTQEAHSSTASLAESSPKVSIVKSLLERGRYPEAETEARRHLEEIEARGGPEDLETAEALDQLADCLLRNSHELGAVAPAERAVRIKEDLLGPSDLGLATSLDTLGIALLSEDWKKAQPLLERALEIRREALGPDHLLVAQSLFDLGREKERAGDRDESRRLREEALRIREKALGPDDPLVADSLCSLGRLDVYEGDLESDRRRLERALEIREKALGTDHPEVALTLQLLGELAFHRGDEQEARTLYERALDVGNRTLGPAHPKVAFVMNDLGWLLGEMGDTVHAIPLVERSLKVDEDWFGPQDARVARELDTLSVLHRDLGQLDKARAYGERGLTIMEGLQDSHIRDHLSNLATIFALMGRREEAKRLYERSLETVERSFGPHHFWLAQPSLQLARLLEDMNDVSGARQALERARDVLEQTFGDEDPKLAEVLAEIAKLDLKEGKREKALTNALHAESIARDHLCRTARSLPDREALRYEQRRVACLDVPLSILSNGPDDAEWRSSVAARTWDAVIRSRALLLDEMAERHRSIPGPRVAEIASRALASARSRYAQILAQGPAGKDAGPYLSRLHRARTEMERAERDLASNSAAFRSEQQEARAGLAAVLGSIPSSGALVAYVEYGGEQPLSDDPRGFQSASAVSTARYLAFVVGEGASAPFVVPLGPAAEIDALVRAWRQEVVTPPSDTAAISRYAQAGEALRRAIWDPVAALLGHARKVYVVPDGELHLVNLGTLPIGGDRYLIESGPEVISVSAERDLVRAKKQPEPSSKLLVLGGADFDADPGALVAPLRDKPSGGKEGAAVYRGATSECADFRSLHFGPIAGSLAEAREVGALWKQAAGAGSRVIELSGAQAGEAAFKRLAPGCTAIHVATHGFSVQERCGAGASSHGQGFHGGGRAAEENPLHLSGLAMAGANRRNEPSARTESDDGILTAEEIATLDLRAAEWVVLSSCESGVGPIQRGEGVLGLQRAFRIAGAGSLVLSLWPVADDDARQWVRNLYEARLSGLKISESVRRASLLMLGARRRLGSSTHPFFWGAFVAAGSPLANRSNLPPRTHSGR